MQLFRVKTDRDGGFIIPTPIRKQLQIEPGQELSLSIEANVLKIKKVENNSTSNWQTEIIKDAVKKASSMEAKFTDHNEVINFLKSWHSEESS